MPFKSTGQEVALARTARMRRRSTGVVVGFHGCEPTTARDLLAGRPFKPSRNDYDWIGSGIYFFEADAKRARIYLEQARQRSAPGGKKPAAAVIGAFIDLGLCLDLTTQEGLADLRIGHASLSALHLGETREMPRNGGGHGNPLRYLDCAVINHVHALRERAGAAAYVSVRGAFSESDVLYEGTDLTALGHIQIAVRDPQAILGVFRPETGGWRWRD